MIAIFEEFKFAIYLWTSAYAPFFALNMSRQYSISHLLFSSISLFTVARTLLIYDCNVSMSRTGVLCTLVFYISSQKKFKGVISGDLGSHGVGPISPNSPKL